MLRSKHTMGLFFRLLLVIPLGSVCHTSIAATVERQDFDRLADGRMIEAVVLTNENGVEATIITLGATLRSLVVPDRNGNLADIVLGYSGAARYLEQPQYFGSTVGRFANRIADGRFSLDGKDYQLERNDGPNHLHGGVAGFDKNVWRVESVGEGSAAEVVLAYTSADGEGGYPGKLDVRATYALNDRDELTIAYEATTDAPTIVNITNHSYFNLGGDDGDSDILGHELTLFSDQFTPVDATLIPTGELRSVADTPFDFRTPKTIGRDIRVGGNEQLRYGQGYDHNFVLRGEPGTLRRAARLKDVSSGRVMELLTTAPAVQFYSGNFLDGSIAGKSNRVYRQSDALCLEPQVYPDAPNKKHFPSARLDPGETYKNTMVLRFLTAGDNE